MKIGPFFYYRGKVIANAIPTTDGEERFGKFDNPCSHEKLYDNTLKVGDYINVPRGRVVWDIPKCRAIIYVDTCIEKANGAVEDIVSVFELQDYILEHDEHYVCPKCIGNIWDV